jgi:Ca2+ transporting ATPase
MSDHFLFPIIVASIFALQILLVTFAGNAFGVYSNYGLTIQQWLISVRLL